MVELYQNYKEKVAAGQLKADSAQADMAQRFDMLATQLSEMKTGWFSKPVYPKGLYIWGGVGRGKSMLMDLFHAHTPLKPALRTHFHDFMLETHSFIAQWRKLDEKSRRKHAAYVKGVGEDPIPPAAKHIADKARLLCFDEFHVTDIADAMILGRLFEQLWKHDIVVVATSNRHPDDLYAGGVNRDLFKPFIGMIKDKLDIIELKSDMDYRLERLIAAPVYYSPLNQASDNALQEAWVRLTKGVSDSQVELTVQGRTLRVSRHAAGCAFFSFSELCDKPLGAADYLVIARRFHTVFIEHVPMLTPANRNAAKRFVTLIDALYESRTKLVLSAEAEPDDLYPEGDGAFEFERTASRLHEMRSKDYLAAGRSEEAVAP
ncbi:cell division protein ZapE [Hirschia baltica]|uniref:AFG1-family ATPase n=1 Tax=Hirschia baltica (strain ATCC 49814 / DSM 5838 / IFAM 1418) TaxID=582402 RepID=C6XMM2_HIRBI|nr:cell division protein ZapE [Hirschia baltica]ACT59936.1 AFG1-family ATPase [Hirschia baltica ATCC 49814]